MLQSYTIILKPTNNYTFFLNFIKKNHKKLGFDTLLFCHNFAADSIYTV